MTPTVRYEYICRGLWCEVKSPHGHQAKTGKVVYL